MQMKNYYLLKNTKKKPMYKTHRKQFLYIYYYYGHLAKSVNHIKTGYSRSYKITYKYIILYPIQLSNVPTWT